MNDDIYNGDTSRVKTRGTRLNYRRASALPLIFTYKVFVLICFCCSFLSSLCPASRPTRLCGFRISYHT